MDRPVEEIEWEGELSFTEAEMLKDVYEIATTHAEKLYKGQGAFTVGELVELAIEKGQDMCEATMRKLCKQEVEDGTLIEVTVKRIGKNRRTFKPLAYVKPEVYEFFMRKSE